MAENRKSNKILFRVDPELHQAAQAKATRQGLTLSAVIRALLFWWIRPDSDLKNLPK
jgi:predicted HicB family RNase H-like nuclease